MKYGVQIVKQAKQKWCVTFLKQKKKNGKYTARKKGKMFAWINHSKPDASLELLKIVSGALKGKTPGEI